MPVPLVQSAIVPTQQAAQAEMARIAAQRRLSEQTAQQIQMGAEQRRVDQLLEQWKNLSYSQKYKSPLKYYQFIDHSAADKYLRSLGFSDDAIRYAIRTYAHAHNAEVLGSSQSQQTQIKLAGSGLSKEEAKQVVTTSQITREQAMRLSPQVRESLGVKFSAKTGIMQSETQAEVKDAVQDTLQAEEEKFQSFKETYLKQGASESQASDMAYESIHGGASPLLNLGPVVKVGSFKEFGQTYWTNIKDPKSTADAIVLASTIVSGPSTAIAFALNRNNFEKVLTPGVSNETKLATVGEIALSLGTSAIGSGLLGAGMKFSEDAISAAGYKILANILKNGGSAGQIVFKNIAGLSLVGAGKLTKFGITTYFKTQMLGAGLETVGAIKEKDYYEASLSGAGLLGGLIGFPLGEKIGGKAFDVASYLSGEMITARSEIPTIKTSPSAITSEMITAKGEKVYGYRRGPIKIGLEFQPRFDKYMASWVKNPTEQVFFRIEETKGVKGKKIQPALSIPEFVQPPTYFEMFKANLKGSERTSAYGKLIDALINTPVLTDVVTVAKFLNEFKGSEALRQRIIMEQATSGKLSSKTQRDLLKVESRVSDKMREGTFPEEQEMSFRKSVKLAQGSEIAFTRDAKGRLLPVIYEKGAISPVKSFANQAKIIAEQDAKFIQRQYEMWQKFGDKYVQPKEHSVKHAKSVAENVRQIVYNHPEYHSYLIGEYGSVEGAIKELQLGAKFHDIGKTRESSKEFGTPHAIKFYNVWKEGLLPEEAQLIVPSVAKAIKTHEKLDPRSIFYKAQNILGMITPEQKILATADRMDLARYNMIVDQTRLPVSETAIKKTKSVSTSNEMDAKIRSNYEKFVADLNKVYSGVSETLKTSAYKKAETYPSVKGYPETYPSVKGYPETYPSVKGYPETYPSVKGYPETYPSVKGYPETYPSVKGYPSPYAQEKVKKNIIESTIYNEGKILAKQKLDLGPGFDVYVKLVKTNKFTKINSTPVSKSRASDIGTYYVSNSLARTFKMEKNGKAREDFQFMFIPIGYFEAKKQTLRAYRIKEGQKYAFGEQYIQKAMFALSSEAEKSQIQEFKRLKKASF